MHLSVAKLEHLRKIVKICFVKNPYIKISKIAKNFKRAGFARRTIYNTIITIAYCNSIKGKKKTDRCSILAPTKKHNLRRHANRQKKVSPTIK